MLDVYVWYHKNKNTQVWASSELDSSKELTINKYSFLRIISISINIDSKNKHLFLKSLTTARLRKAKLPLKHWRDFLEKQSRSTANSQFFVIKTLT